MTKIHLSLNISNYVAAIVSVPMRHLLGMLLPRLTIGLIAYGMQTTMEVYAA